MDTLHRTAPRDRVIASVGDLDDAMYWRSIVLNRSPIQFRLRGLSPERLAFWQTTIDHRVAACGCVEGAIGGAAFLGIFLLYLGTGGSTMTGSVMAGLGFGVFCLGILVGHLVGMVRTHVLLRQTKRQLRAVLLRLDGCDQETTASHLEQPREIARS